ncbi:MAG: hypothetical protein MPJ50_14605 [Pirellulales bacterium]|nr:hypothetical protein [Pirellulales bacterium]
MLAQIRRRRGISVVEMVVIAAVIGIGVIIAVSAMSPSVSTELNTTADFVGDPASFGKNSQQGS